MAGVCKVVDSRFSVQGAAEGSRVGGVAVCSSVQPVSPSGCCPRKSDLSAGGFRVSWGVPC